MKRFLSLLLFISSQLLFAQQGRTDRGTITPSERTQSYVFQSRKSVYSDSPKRCYVLALGVQGPFIDQKNLATLDFPDQDCLKLVNAVRSIFQYDYEVRSFGMMDQDNSRRYYKPVLDLLKQVKDQPVQAGDLAILYFSGHGITKNKHFYFPMVDADVDYDLNMISGERIMELAAALADKGADVLLLLDTCQSGGILLEGDPGLEGKGGIACFPAASAATSTQEWVEKSSTPFGDRARSLISGEGFRSMGANDMTVSLLGARLGAVMDGVEPVYYNSPSSNVEERILVDRIQQKLEYNDLLSRYKSYLGSAERALQEKRYDQALSDYGNAAAFKDLGLETRDLRDLEPDFKELNRKISAACKESSYNDVWKSLSNLDETNEHLNKSVVNLMDLFNGCGAYYKRKGDPKTAYRFFMKAHKTGDLRNAPLDIYNLLVEHPEVADEPVDPEQYLTIASRHGNKNAADILNGATIPVKEKKSGFSVWDLGVEDPLLGFSLVSDFKSTCPIGFKFDFFLSVFHLGLDFNYMDVSNQYSSSFNVKYTDEDGNPLPFTSELTNSEMGEPFGVFSWTITPGFVLKWVSIDCGLGQIKTYQAHTYTYKDTYESTGTITTTFENTRTEIEDVYKRSFFLKPGLSAIIPIDGWGILLGARYRFCPSDTSLNGIEAMLGCTIPLEY